MNTDYWGEIPAVADTDSGIAALEREQITKPRAMDVDGPPLHQPSSRHQPPSNEILASENFQMDPLVIHSIRLIQHIKKVQGAIVDLQSEQKSDPDSAAYNVGPIPAYDGPPLAEPRNKKIYSEEDYQRPFVQGEGKPPPAIDEMTCRKLLRRSTAAICAHLSFDSSSESVLETLTDVCHEFLCQMTRHLASAADRRGTHGCLGFPDIVERVFHDMGLGSVSELHTFYQQRVLQYHKRLLKQCEQLMTQHTAQVKQPPSALKAGHSSPTDGDTLHVIRIKDEPSSDMQFPLLDENDEVNDAEQLLNIESLGTFEITVEHETAAGLTTEVDTKWSTSQAGKSNTGESRIKSSNSIDETTDNEAGGSQSTVPSTPVENVATPHSSAATPRDPSSQEAVNIQDPGSISSMDIFSPETSASSKAKKKKKS